MRVEKRNGKMEEMSLDKISLRLKQLLAPIGALPALAIDHMPVAQRTCQGLFDGITTQQIDIISSEIAVSLTTTDPEYEVLGARILVSNLHKSTKTSVLETFQDLYRFQNSHGESQPLVSESVAAAVRSNHRQLQRLVDYNQDYAYSFFGLKTLLKGYLLGPANKPIERPQHMLLRVAIGIWGCDVNNVAETYKSMSNKLYTHATPTLFNMGTKIPASSSCYLLGTTDSAEGLMDTMKQCAMISKNAGGLGLHVSNVRGSGALIRGTGGHSSGIVPLAKTFNDLLRWFNQSGRRKGSIALYLEPWHVDVEDFVQLRRPQGVEEMRARDVFLALWLNDTFMRRVEADEEWSLMDPDACPGLADAWGDEFELLYTRYEREGKYVRRLKALKLWTLILQSQIESGMPYCLSKDASNRKSNQAHLGTIKSSNLCCEVMLVSDHKQTSVCNLASVALSNHIKDGSFDHHKLHATTQRVVRNLDRMLTVACYPTPEARETNARDRPLGIGVQGLADTFIALRLPFDSPEAAQLNRDIAETMYHAALTASTALAAELGPHASYQGSPISQGKLQFDLWHQTTATGSPTGSSRLWNWKALRDAVAEQGVRNSVLTALMPTCSTSQILGCNESFQPINSNLYSRRTGAGSFVCINRQLVKDLKEKGLWCQEVKDEIIFREGSIQEIRRIPQDLRDLYKTIWELKQKVLIDLAAARGPFIDQSQSMNLFLPEPSLKKLSLMLFHAWKAGCKTLMYYCHIRPEAKAVQVTLDPSVCEGCTA